MTFERSGGTISLFALMLLSNGNADIVSPPPSSLDVALCLFASQYV